MHSLHRRVRQSTLSLFHIFTHSSLHLPKDSQISKQTISKLYHAVFSEQISKAVANKWPDKSWSGPTGTAYLWKVKEKWFHYLKFFFVVHWRNYCSALVLFVNICSQGKSSCSLLRGIHNFLSFSASLRVFISCKCSFTAASLMLVLFFLCVCMCWVKGKGWGLFCLF